MQVDISADRSPAPPVLAQHSFIRRVTAFFVRLFERYTPDPYVLAVALSILTAVLAALFAPKGSVTTIFTGWYNGLFSILAFAFQVLLILVTGYALSTASGGSRDQHQASNGIYRHELFARSCSIWCGFADSCLRPRGFWKSDKSSV